MKLANQRRNCFSTTMEKWSILSLVVIFLFHFANCATLKEKRGIDDDDSAKFGGWRPILPGSPFFYGSGKDSPETQHAGGGGGASGGSLLPSTGRGGNAPKLNSEVSSAQETSAIHSQASYQPINENAGILHGLSLHGAQLSGLEGFGNLGHGGHGGGATIQIPTHEVSVLDQAALQEITFGQFHQKENQQFQGHHNDGGHHHNDGGHHHDSGNHHNDGGHHHNDGGHHHNDGGHHHDSGNHHESGNLHDSGHHNKGGHQGIGSSSSQGPKGIEHLKSPVPNKDIFAYYPPPTTPKPFPEHTEPKPLYLDKPIRETHVQQFGFGGKSIPVLQIDISSQQPFGGLKSTDFSNSGFSLGSGIKSSDFESHQGNFGHGGPTKSGGLEGQGGGFHHQEGIKSSQVEGFGNFGGQGGHGNSGGGGQHFDIGHQQASIEAQVHQFPIKALLQSAGDHVENFQHQNNDQFNIQQFANSFPQHEIKVGFEHFPNLGNQFQHASGSSSDQHHHGNDFGGLPQGQSLEEHQKHQQNFHHGGDFPKESGSNHQNEFQHQDQQGAHHQNQQHVEFQHHGQQDETHHGAPQGHSGKELEYHGHQGDFNQQSLGSPHASNGEHNYQQNSHLHGSEQQQQQQQHAPSEQEFNHQQLEFQQQNPQQHNGPESQQGFEHQQVEYHHQGQNNEKGHQSSQNEQTKEVFQESPAQNPPRQAGFQHQQIVYQQGGAHIFPGRDFDFQQQQPQQIEFQHIQQQQEPHVVSHQASQGQQFVHQGLQGPQQHHQNSHQELFGHQGQAGQQHQHQNSHPQEQFVHQPIRPDFQFERVPQPQHSIQEVRYQNQPGNEQLTPQPQQQNHLQEPPRYHSQHVINNQQQHGINNQQQHVINNQQQHVINNQPQQQHVISNQPQQLQLEIIEAPQVVHYINHAPPKEHQQFHNQQQEQSHQQDHRFQQQDNNQHLQQESLHQPQQEPQHFQQEPLHQPQPEAHHFQQVEHHGHHQQQETVHQPQHQGHLVSYNVEHPHGSHSNHEQSLRGPTPPPQSYVNIKHHEKEVSHVRFPDNLEPTQLQLGGPVPPPSQPHFVYQPLPQEGPNEIRHPGPFRGPPSGHQAASEHRPQSHKEPAEVEISFGSFQQQGHLEPIANHVPQGQHLAQGGHHEPQQGHQQVPQGHHQEGLEPQGHHNLQGHHEPQVHFEAQPQSQQHEPAYHQRHPQEEHDNSHNVQGDRFVHAGPAPNLPHQPQNHNEGNYQPQSHFVSSVPQHDSQHQQSLEPAHGGHQKGVHLVEYSIDHSPQDNINNNNNNAGIGHQHQNQPRPLSDPDITIVEINSNAAGQSQPDLLRYPQPGGATTTAESNVYSPPKYVTQQDDKHVQHVDDPYHTNHQGGLNNQDDGYNLQEPEGYYSPPSLTHFPPPRAPQPVYRPDKHHQDTNTDYHNNNQHNNHQDQQAVSHHLNSQHTESHYEPEHYQSSSQQTQQQQPPHSDDHLQLNHHPNHQPGPVQPEPQHHESNYNHQASHQSEPPRYESIRHQPLPVPAPQLEPHYASEAGHYNNQESQKDNVEFISVNHQDTPAKPLGPASTKPHHHGAAGGEPTADGKDPAQVYHAYYAPADHSPPAGYIRLSVNDFNKYFKDAEIQYVGSESQNKDVSPNALGDKKKTSTSSSGSEDDIDEKDKPKVYFSQTPKGGKNKTKTSASTTTSATTTSDKTKPSDDEENFEEGPVLTLDLKPGQSVEDALSELGTISVEGIRIDASQLKEGRDFEVVDVSPVLEDVSSDAEELGNATINPIAGVGLIQTKTMSSSSSSSSSNSGDTTTLKPSSTRVKIATTTHRPRVSSHKYSSKKAGLSNKPVTSTTTDSAATTTNGYLRSAGVSSTIPSNNYWSAASAETTSVTSAEEVSNGSYGERIRPLKKTK